MRLCIVSQSCLLWLGVLAANVTLAAARPSFSPSNTSPTRFGLTTTKRPRCCSSSLVFATDIRGGNIAPGETTPPASSSSPIKTTTSNVLTKVGPYWKSFSKLVQEKSKLVQEKVEPALKDPRSTIWDPFQKFVETQKQVAHERQVIVKQQDPKQAASLLLKPSRFVKIGIAAWIVAEVLHQMGFFDNPAGVGPKLQQLYKDHAEEICEQVQYKLQDWYEEERMEGGWLNIHTYRNVSLLLRRIRNLPPRYQFAIGGGLGMLVSPVVWALAMKFTKAFAITYVVSEVNEYWRDQSSVGESAFEMIGFRGKGGDRINDFLEQVRENVRSTFLYPDKFWSDTKELMTEDDVDGFSAGTKQGILLGTIIGVVI